MIVVNVVHDVKQVLLPCRVVIAMRGISLVIVPSIFSPCTVLIMSCLYVSSQALRESICKHNMYLVI